mgnify:CR=1 FL=1
MLPRLIKRFITIIFLFSLPFISYSEIIYKELTLDCNSNFTQTYNEHNPAGLNAYNFTIKKDTNIKIYLNKQNGTGNLKLYLQSDPNEVIKEINLAESLSLSLSDELKFNIDEDNTYCIEYDFSLESDILLIFYY